MISERPMPTRRLILQSAAALILLSGRLAGTVGEPPSSKWLVCGTIPAGVPTMVAAQGDTGKSMLLLELGCRVAFGASPLATPVFNGHVAREGTVVIFTAEDGKAEVHRRIHAIDAKGGRFSEKGDRLIVVPLPEIGGPMPLVTDQRGELRVTEEYKRITDQLVSIPDLALVVFDPLQAFVHAKINEDPAAGQFVCSQLAALATATGATIMVAHHMRKSPDKRPVKTLADARTHIRRL